MSRTEELDRQWRELGDQQRAAAKELHEARERLERTKRVVSHPDEIDRLKRAVEDASARHGQIGRARENVGGQIDLRSDAWDIL